jgi:hypothetical protein
MLFAFPWNLDVREYLSTKMMNVEQPESMMAPIAPPDDRERPSIQALGTAIVHVWAELPEPIQEKLFEHAVVAGHRSERDESLREELARFLHDHHARTSGTPTQ